MIDYALSGIRQAWQIHGERRRFLESSICAVHMFVKVCVEFV